MNHDAAERAWRVVRRESCDLSWMSRGWPSWESDSGRRCRLRGWRLGYGRRGARGSGSCRRPGRDRRRRGTRSRYGQCFRRRGPSRDRGGRRIARAAPTTNSLRRTGTILGCEGKADKDGRQGELDAPNASAKRPADVPPQCSPLPRHSTVLGLNGMSRPRRAQALDVDCGELTSIGQQDFGRDGDGGAIGEVTQQAAQMGR